MNNLQLKIGKKAYFVSDQHFTYTPSPKGKYLEHFFCDWLEEIAQETQYLFLLGDLFDFWFEYKKVIPKGFVRCFGTLVRLIEKFNVTVYFFTGNHDMWVRDYFEKELGIIVFKTPQTFFIDGVKILAGHGDGLGGHQSKYLAFKTLLLSRFFNFFFRQIHPDLGIRLGEFCSQTSRKRHRPETADFHPEKEHLVLYCRKKNDEDPHRYFVFGHRHRPMKLEITPQCHYINTGDWIQDFTYARFENGEMCLQTYEKP